MATLGSWPLTSNLKASTTAAGVTNSDVSKSASVPSIGVISGFGLDMYIAEGSRNLADAVSKGSYVQFTCTADAGKQINLASIAFRLISEPSGAANTYGYGLRSSVDSYANNIVSATAIPNDPSYVDVSKDMSGAPYQGLSAITFRVYYYADNDDNEVILNSLVLSGTVDASAAALPFFADFCGGLNDDLTGGI